MRTFALTICLAASLVACPNFDSLDATANSGDDDASVEASIGSTQDASLEDAPVDSIADASVVFAQFTVSLNGSVQTPLTCPAYLWQFPEPLNDGGTTGVGVGTSSRDAGQNLLALKNVGTVPIAYISESEWNDGHHYIPDVPASGVDEQVGILAPGDEMQRDLTNDVSGGELLLGSTAMFSTPSATVGDEGAIAWPASVPGAGGNAQMQVAEISFEKACGPITQFW